MKILLLITTLALAESRPQNQGKEVPVSIEFEKHEVIQLEPINVSSTTVIKEAKHLDAATYEILKKIDDINQKYGYTSTRSPARSTNVQIPHFYEHSYDRPLPVRLGNFLNQKVSSKSLNTEDIKQMNIERHNFIQSQMLNNVKGIILKSQLPPYIQGLNNFNPLVQNLPFLNSFIPYKKSENYDSSGYINNVPNMPFNEYKVDGYQPDRDIPKNTKPIENGNTGIFNYLRILFDLENHNITFGNVSERTGKQYHFSQQPQPDKLKFIIESIKKGVQIAEYNDAPNTKKFPRNLNGTAAGEIVQLEDIANVVKNNSTDFTDLRLEKSLKKVQTTKKTDTKTLNPLQFIIQQQNKFKQTTTTTQLPFPVEDSDLKDIINENNKKLLSRDNTGSGIFIHRIKVKKGGVAIAGPGGIATAGSGGTAIVGPNGYAYTHPDSLAIAGTGSKVIAVEPNVNLADIINGNHKGRRVGKVVAIGPVIYYNKGRIQEIPYKVNTIPFYGGAQGQALQLVESPDGIISSKVIILDSTSEKPDLVNKATEYEHPELPSKYEAEDGFNIKGLQKSAVKIINFQQNAQEKPLNTAQQEQYETEMEILSEYARNIADLQLSGAGEDFFNDEGLTAWFDRKRIEQAKKKGNSTQTEDIKKKESSNGNTNNTNKVNVVNNNKDDKKDKNKTKEKQKQKPKEKESEKEKEENSNKQPEKGEEEEEEEEEDADGVVVNLPPDDASVAEAKPVGLAVAGAGGVAASKPVATAVVGPAGLAIARPVGTAIAGVDPEQSLVPIFAEGLVKPSKKREPSSSKKQQTSSSDLLNKIISKYHQV